MGTPQIIVLFLIGISLGSDMIMHGKQKTTTVNIWKTLVAVALNIGLLWWGGFFG